MDDAVPMARDEKAQQVVQDLMQRYGRDTHLVWSAEKSAVLRGFGEEGMALDVGDGVAWLERAEEAVVLGHVQATEARGVRLPDKLVRGFRAMLVFLRHHPPSVQRTLYYLRAVLNRFGPPRSPVAILSPPCRLPVAFLALLAPCRSPVACLLLPCCSPVALLLLPCCFPVAFLPPSCRYPVASRRFLLFPVAMLLFAWRLPVAVLSPFRRSFLSLSCRYCLLPPCRPPVACLSSSCRPPVASLSPPCRFPVAQCGNLLLSCRLPVACLSLACRLPVATLSPSCRLPVASLSPNVVPCCSPVACLSLACRLPVAFLSPPCRLPVASLSPPCRLMW